MKFETIVLVWIFSKESFSKLYIYIPFLLVSSDPVGNRSCAQSRGLPTLPDRRRYGEFHPGFWRTDKGVHCLTGEFSARRLIIRWTYSRIFISAYWGPNWRPLLNRSLGYCRGIWGVSGVVNSTAWCREAPVSQMYVRMTVAEIPSGCWTNACYVAHLFFGSFFWERELGENSYEKWHAHTVVIASQVNWHFYTHILTCIAYSACQSI